MDYTCCARINKFDEVVVSTDCEETAEISLQFASVPFLRETDFDDITPVSKATINYTSKLESFYKKPISTVTQLMANCPLRNSTDIIEFLDDYQSMNVDFLLSSFKFGWMNPWWAFNLNGNNENTFLFPKALSERSQDQENLIAQRAVFGWEISTSSRLMALFMVIIRGSERSHGRVL